MDAMSSMIAANLKRIRKEKKLSLDNAAEMTGVSKSMLGQIERGESSPTVATLWKIATGLHISFTALLEGQAMETKIIQKEDIRPLLSDEGRFRFSRMTTRNALKCCALRWIWAVARNPRLMRKEQKNC